MIEVLAALVIFGLFSTVLVSETSGLLRYQSRLQDRMWALTLAENKLVTLRVLRTFPSKGRSKDTVNQAGKEWSVITSVEETPYEALRKINVEVYLGDMEKNPVAELSTYLGKY